MEYHVEGLLRGGLFRDLLDKQSAVIREKYGLKKADIEVLFYLYQHREENTAKDIQHFLNKNKGYISQIVDEMCKRGYLTAVTDAEDRRYVHYLICPKTEEVAREMQAVWSCLSEQLFEGVSEEEQLIFQKVAKILRKNMMEMLMP